MRASIFLRVSRIILSSEEMLSLLSRTKDHDDPSSSVCRFLSWVAYDRNLAGRSQITDDERLRCPIIWCRGAFHDQNKLLEHVFRCAQFSDGRYWCFHCQKEESFAPSRVPAFRKERLSVKAKRILRWLGTKSHHKDHEAFDPSARFKGAFGISDSQCSGYPAHPSEDPYTAAEMDGIEVSRELEDDDCTSYAELDGLASLPAELDSKSKSKSAVSEENLPQLQSPVSPQSNRWMRASYAGEISESPTDTDFSTDSLFSKSFGNDISPPSTRNSTMQSCSQGSLVIEKPLEYVPALPAMANILDEVPDITPEEKVTGAGLVSNNLFDALDSRQSTEREVLAHLGPSHWHTPQGFLHDFWKVLVLHVAESSEKLKNLPSNPSINELLSMTAKNIAHTGLSAWKNIVDGKLPATLAQLYALMHIAYACTIVNFDGQVGNRIERLFTHSFAIEAGALSDEDKSTYTKIAWLIWSPPLDDINPHSNKLEEFCDQPDRAASGQSWAKGKAKFCLTDINEQLIRSLSMKEGPVSMNSHSSEGNEILNMLAFFIDSKAGRAINLNLPTDI
jgi:hypothetical protein